jgi:hypothetical protein
MTSWLSAGDGANIMTSDAALSLLLLVLREPHCKAVAEWPSAAGGGQHGVAEAVVNSVDVLQVGGVLVWCCQ